MKSLILMMALLVSSNAFATKARMIALGQPETDDGSYYIDDDRRVFQNAAYAYDLAGHAVVEFGQDSGSPLSLDTTAAPEPQGGVFKKSGDMVYGLHLGYESNTGALVRNLAGLFTPKLDNTLQLFAAGQAGVQWGVGLLYSKYKIENGAGTADDEFNAYAVRLGAKDDKWEAFANVSVSSDAEDPNAAVKAKFEGSIGLWVGGSYDLCERNTVFANYKKLGWDSTTGATDIKAEGAYSQINVGLGHVHKYGKGNIFADVMYRTTNIEVDFAAAGTADTEVTYTRLPITFGYEAPATDWLTLRGSITHNLMGSVEEKNVGSLDTIDPTTTLSGTLAPGQFTGLNGTDGKRTIPNSTNVAAGASLTFGKLQVDGLIGLEDGSANELGQLRLDALFTRASMVYRF